MKLFISINISEDLKEESAILQAKLKKFNDVNISPKENLHITLKFIGETNNLEEIITKLDKIEFKEFTMTSAGAGFFPDENNIRIAWIGFKPCEELILLRGKICDYLGRQFKDELKFVPHLTIARMKRILPNEKKAIKEVQNTIIKKIEFKIDAFNLMESELSSKGPKYRSIKEFKAKSL